MPTAPSDVDLRKQRQVIYWRLLAGVFGMEDQAKNLEKITRQIIDHLQLPELITDPNLAIDTLVQRYPELKDDFESIRKVCNPEENANATQPTIPEPELQPTDL